MSAPPDVGAPIRIAMWSGPRNLSTALMRSFEARGDCAVIDEPLYAHYLEATGLEHPGREATLASQPRDWRSVADALTGPVPGNRSIWYQKHMAHHLLPAIERGWLEGFRHAFLIRDPQAVLASMIEVWPEPTLEDTGLPQQVELYERLVAEGAPPPVVDSSDLLGDPAGVLEGLCGALGIPWTESMLSWSPGRRATDGVWADHWYASVEASTGFGPLRTRSVELPARLEGLLERARELNAVLRPHRLLSKRALR